MSQALSALPVAVTSVPTAASPGEIVEPTDSASTFDQALTGQMTGDKPLSDSPAVAAPGPTCSTLPSTIAADGKELPPMLPPEATIVAGMPAALAVLLDTQPDAELHEPGVQESPATTVVEGAPTAALLTIASATTGVVQPGGELPGLALPDKLSGELRVREQPAVVAAANNPLSANVRFIDQQPAGVADIKTVFDPAAAGEEMVSVEEALKPSPLHGAIFNTRADSAAAALSYPGFSLPTTASNNAALTAPPVTVVAQPFGHADWSQAFSNRVVWAVNQNLPSAELHLSPPDLGPVSVRISMDNDQSQASISFSAAHGAVREAIEAALPRLRDMLSTQGIALADVNVSSHENFQQAQRESATGRSERGRAGEGGDSESGADLRTAVRAIGLLDTYA